MARKQKNCKAYAAWKLNEDISGWELDMKVIGKLLVFKYKKDARALYGRNVKLQKIEWSE